MSAFKVILLSTFKHLRTSVNALMADSALLVLVKMLGLLEKKKTIVAQIDCKSNQSQRKAK